MMWLLIFFVIFISSILSFQQRLKLSVRNLSFNNNKLFGRNDLSAKEIVCTSNIYSDLFLRIIYYYYYDYIYIKEEFQRNKVQKSNEISSGVSSTLPTTKR
jgi:hypothetical protein